MAEVTVKANSRRWWLYFDKHSPPQLQKMVLMTLMNDPSKYILVDKEGNAIPTLEKSQNEEGKEN